MPRRNARVVKGQYDLAASNDLDCAADYIDETAKNVEYFIQNPESHHGVDPTAIKIPLAKLRKAMKRLNKACKDSKEISLGFLPKKTNP